MTFTVPAALRLDTQINQRLGIRGLVRGVQRGDQNAGGGSQLCRSHPSWFLRRIAHLGAHGRLSHPCSLCSARRWHQCRRPDMLPSHAQFFVTVRPAVDSVSTKFRDALLSAGLLTEVDPAVWRQDWVALLQAVGDGRASSKYLALYVFRVAISDRRIVSYDDDSVIFSHRKSGSNRWRRMTLDPPEFLRRFLQHVLPTGFQKVRHYGFLSPNSRVSLDMVRWLIALYQKVVFFLASSAESVGAFWLGESTKLCKRASFATFAVRKPYDFLVTSFTLLLSPSTAPAETCPRARNQFRINGR